jgi:hypothetical protein
VSIGAAVASTLWLASGLGAARRFREALGDPSAAQGAWLRRQLARHAASEFGQSHDFAALRTPADFVRRVPLCRYDDIAPAVARVRRGDRDVLATGRVTNLAPTSGSTGARKLIPFTASLQGGFDAAVSAWMHDLARQRPALVAGPAYWSVSPLADEDAESPGTGSSGAIPVGFADDADYLGAGSAWLVRQVLAAPSSLRHVRDARDFWRLTALALLRRRDLRLISVWHPSFLDLLVTAAAESWRELVDAVASGDCPWIEALPPRARDGWRVAPVVAAPAGRELLGGAGGRAGMALAGATTPAGARPAQGAPRDRGGGDDPVGHRARARRHLALLRVPRRARRRAPGTPAGAWRAVRGRRVQRRRAVALSPR